MPTSAATDHWKDWLLKHRHGGDPEHHQRVIQGLLPVRDKVLTNAQLVEGETLLDVGTGDGMIGFGALPIVGDTGRVIFTDISEPLVELCREYATQSGSLDRCEFHVADATDLSMIPDASVDVVTTRSVLIYVADKQKALSEFFRVLKPKGRISLFEPIAKVYQTFARGRYLGYDVAPVRHLMEKLRGDGRTGTDPMSDFDERDLAQLALNAGFGFVGAEMNLNVGYCRAPYAGNWEAFLNGSPNPLVPIFREQMATSLTPEEQTELTSYLRPLVERGEGFYSQALCYFVASKM